MKILEIVHCEFWCCGCDTNRTFWNNDFNFYHITKTCCFVSILALFYHSRNMCVHSLQSCRSGLHEDCVIIIETIALFESWFGNVAKLFFFSVAIVWGDYLQLLGNRYYLIKNYRKCLSLIIPEFICHTESFFHAINLDFCSFHRFEQVFISDCEIYNYIFCRWFKVQRKKCDSIGIWRNSSLIKMIHVSLVFPVFSKWERPG